MHMLICICENDAGTVAFLQQECIKFYKRKRDHLDFIVYDNGDALIKNKNDFDLIFLDIELNGLNGLEAAYRLREFNQYSQIIVVSAYQNYKASAYAAHVFDFIDKPIQEIRLHDVLCDVESYFQTHQVKHHLYFNIHGEIHQTDIKDILYLEAMNRKIKIVFKDTSVLFYGKLQAYQRVLIDNGFGIPHRSFIVNYEKIKCIRKDSITMTNDDLILIARPRSKVFKQQFSEYLRQSVFHKGKK